MLLAVLADVHANIHALTPVAAAVRALNADCVVILGDIVGYNAAPVECIALVRELGTHVVLGNHDHDAVNEPSTLGTGNAARRVQQWTRHAITDGDAEYLRTLPRIVHEPDGFLAVHGCYLNDTHYTGYVTSTMVPMNLAAIAKRGSTPVALCGHTHSPMLAYLTGEQVVESRLQASDTWPATASAVLINPGAVGQPRDGDPRAAFAVVDTERRTVEVRRVAYDIAAAQQSIQAAGLPHAMAERLQEGR